MNFFGIGLPEMAVIAAIGLLVFGPKRLPELGKTLGKTLRGFQSASQEFEKEFRQAVTPEPEALAVSAATKDPAAQPSPLSPAPSQSIAIEAVPTLVSAPASEPAAATIPAPVAGDPPGS
jgi:sec-independent protein translocase protein TatA